MMRGLKTTKASKKKFFQALYPRERWTPSQWAENCRVLSPEESSEPGPYSFYRTPYWRMPCDLVANPAVEEIVVLKGAQIGWSELCRNILGYWIDLDPGPTLVLMPDQNGCDSFRDERLSPLFAHTPAVAKHLSARTWDTKKYSIKFDTMSLFLTWAGSKSGTKSRPIRYLICEEPDEYPSFSSTGGDPLSKAEKRLTTYADKGRARKLIGGTPTTRSGNTFKRWEMCAVRFHLWVPCPHCNGYQRMQWSQVKWPEMKDESRAKRAEAIRSKGLAYYECQHCKAQIRDHQKPRMLGRGIWATEDQAVTVDGRTVGDGKLAKRVGVFLPSYYSPWVRFSDLAAEWIEAQGDPQALADFINQRLAEPFEEERGKVDATVIDRKASGSPKALTVPAWAQQLIATADTQGNNDSDGYFWYVIRAWSYGYVSQLVDFGVCHSREELRQRVFGRPIAWVDGRTVAPTVLFVDSGGPRWNEVYQLAQSDQRIKPTKGASQSRTWMVTERPQKQHGVVLWEIDTHQAKDLLHSLINDPDMGRWQLCDAVDKNYRSQMVSEAKIWNPNTGKSEWVEIVKKNNHLWDCEAMQCAAAWRFGMGVPPPPMVDQPQQPRRGWVKPNG